MTRKTVLIVAALALVAAACGGDDEGSTDTTPAPTTTQATTAAPTTAAPTTAAPAVAAVTVANSSLGDILADQDGNTLYLFLPDAQGPSVCNGDCAEAWPPLLEAMAGDGVDAALLGSATRDDGSEQVTYNGWPLYYFAGDSAPGDTNGQGVNEVWFVLDAAGDGIGVPAPTTTTEATTTSGAPAAAAVTVTSSNLGDILTDQDGNTLYLFTPDAQGPSVCNGPCAEAWPPLLEAVAGDGIDASLLGTATRDDGIEQVTYNGWPLYYFAADGAPGDVNGQGVNDVWFVLDAAGNGIGVS